METMATMVLLKCSLCRHSFCVEGKIIQSLAKLSTKQ